MSNTTDSFAILNVGPGSYPIPRALKGGKYALIASGTFGGGNVQLQALSMDGVTYINIGASITVAGLINFDLPPGSYQLTVTTATAVYAVIASVPY